MTAPGCVESVAVNRGTTRVLAHEGHSIHESAYPSSQAMCWRQCGQANLISIMALSEARD